MVTKILTTFSLIISLLLQNFFLLPAKPEEHVQMKAVLKTAVFYALGYLYEHREEADHHDLVLTLRNLLFAVREGVF